MNSTSYSTLYEFSNIQYPLTLLSVELEGQRYGSSGTCYGRLTVEGYEITPAQKDGNTLYVRCVR